MNRSGKTTPEQLAAGGLVEYAPGRFCAASDPRAAGVKQSLTTVAAPVPLALPEPMPARLSGRGQWAPYRNKTEWRFAQYLADHRPGRMITYEALRLPLGTIDGKPSHYTSDFQQWRGKELEAVFEVKGGHRWRRQGIDRLRAAAAKYRVFEWWLCEPNASGGWSLKRVEG